MSAPRGTLETIRYTDTAGVTLWEEPASRFAHGSFLAVGATIAEKGIVYRVMAARVEGDIQLVRLTPERPEKRPA